MCVIRCETCSKNRGKMFHLQIDPWLLGTIRLWPAVSLPLTLSYWQWVLSPNSQVCTQTLMIQSQKTETERLTARLSSTLSGDQWLTLVAWFRFSVRWDESAHESFPCLMGKKERKLCTITNQTWSQRQLDSGIRSILVCWSAVQKSHGRHVWCLTRLSHLWILSHVISAHDSCITAHGFHDSLIFSHDSIVLLQG